MRLLFTLFLFFIVSSPAFGQQILPNLITEDARFLRSARESTFIGSGDVDRFIGRGGINGINAEIISQIEMPSPNYNFTQQPVNHQPLFPYRIQIPDYQPKIDIQHLTEIVNYHFNSIEIGVDEEVVVLRGFVDSEREKRIIELLAQFQAGVNSVENLLIVK